ncbi:MAG TPA: Asp-tRNA(Asn)/Glu-tRNA(Gln) amidotransferase subunit GatC [Candidatus Acidoferrales bacterium]|jgi:aspartyl-tRNA(Asn)/glutamyl-tRNA(Gln) amidotransferase subunit C|nr:Asp-tRNA(Asn)/Glu-tRNA(Gln) amidotransferase subunit GatC [Candidatus Acidoferrales bacterium]
MTISREDVLRVAELAHLGLTGEEVDLYRGQLDEILNYIGKLRQLDVTNVEPMIQMSFANESANVVPSKSKNPADLDLREDVVQPCDIGDTILEHAPDAVKPFFRVPKVIER